MPTLDELEVALKNATAAGDMDAARKLAAVVARARNNVVDRIPDMPVGETEQRSPEPTIGEQAVGAGEAAIALVPGGIAGAAGMLGGTLKGLAEELLTGNFGSGHANRVAMQGAQMLSEPFMPSTKAGRDITETVGSALEQTIPLSGLTAELGAISAGINAAKPAAMATAQRVAAPMQSAATKSANTVRSQAPSLSPDIAAAKQAGIDLMTSDVVPPRTFPSKILQATGERIPIAGTSGMRQAQQVQRIEAVRNVLRDFGADDAAKLSDDVMTDLATKRSSDLHKYTTAKKEVIDRLSDKGVVPVDNAMKTIDDQIFNLTKRKTEGADEAIDRLKEIKNSLQNRNLFELEAYRQDELAKVFMDDPVRPISAAAREIGEKALRSIYDPVRRDMGNYIKANGERRDYTKWAVSNKRLAETAQDMQNASLKTVLLKGNVKPEVIQNLLFKGKPSEVRALYSKLTPQGRATARSAILAKAANDASVQVAEGNIISPDRFANNVKKMGDSVGVFFSGDDLKRINGLTRVLNITKRAGEASAVPTTGVQAMPFVAGSLLTDIFGGAGAATVSAITAGGLARIYESAPIRNILMRLSKSRPGSPEESELVNSLNDAIRSQNNK